MNLKKCLKKVQIEFNYTDQRDLVSLGAGTVKKMETEPPITQLVLLAKRYDYDDYYTLLVGSSDFLMKSVLHLIQDFYKKLTPSQQASFVVSLAAILALEGGETNE